MPLEAHAKLSCSGSERWMTCPASVREEQGVPDVSGPDADYGTLGHGIAHDALTSGMPVAEVAPTDFPADDVEALQVYVDHVRNLPGLAWYETRLNLSQWIPGGFGTADALTYHSETKTARVTDLKFGKGYRVPAYRNKQLMCYGLGALHELGGYCDIDTVVLEIVQPRLDHIEAFEITTADLLAFGEDVRAAAELALQPDAPFNPTESACRWCKVRSTCRARAEKSLAEDFKRKPTQMDPDELAALYPRLSEIRQWVDDVEAHMFKQATEHRVAYPGLKVVSGRSVRTFVDDEAAVAARFSEFGVDPWTHKLIGIGAAEKAIGKKRFAESFTDLLTMTKPKPALVMAADPRPELDSPATDFATP